MPDYSYSTHIYLLSMLSKNVRTVLELGSGKYSTALFLNLAVFPDLTELWSVDHNAEWLDRSNPDARRYPILINEPFEPFLERIDLDSFDLIFVDNSESWARREATIRYLAEHVGKSLVVIHDFDFEHYKEAAESFTHFVIDKEHTPWTALVWR